MKELLTLCAKTAYFTFDTQVYQQNDGLVMRSPLEPVFIGIFMVELETQIVPTQGNMSLNWRLLIIQLVMLRMAALI